MKLLFDANISRRILKPIGDLFPESTQVMLAGMSGETPDETIWQYAKRGGYTIVTADGDFIRLADKYGPPPQVIRLDRMDYSTEVAASLLRRYAIAIVDFGKSAKAVLILQRNL